MKRRKILFRPPKERKPCCFMVKPQRGPGIEVPCRRQAIWQLGSLLVCDTHMRRLREGVTIRPVNLELAVRLRR